MAFFGLDSMVFEKIHKPKLIIENSYVFTSLHFYNLEYSNGSDPKLSHPITKPIHVSHISHKPLVAYSYKMSLYQIMYCGS